jgi:hypothetical protein
MTAPNPTPTVSDDDAGLADLFAITIKAALGPLAERVAVLESKSGIGTKATTADADDDRLRTLESRLTALEAKPHVRYCGIWERERGYATGDAVTYQGSLWICSQQHFSEPVASFPHAYWRLAVKRGAVDAR